MDNVKPGFKSTEFWVTVSVQVVAILALFGLFTPEQVKDLGAQLPEMGTLIDEVITKVTALGAMVITAYRYITGRSAVKKGAK